MPPLKDELPFKHHLGTNYALVLHHVVVLLLLTHQCAGQSQIVTPSQSIVATVGDDIMLPCHLEPAIDVTSETVEWARPDMDPRFVYLWRDGEELETIEHPSYVGRTSLSINKLKHGDISLKLDRVKLSDEGTYRCFVPLLQSESLVQLVVGTTSSLIISLEKTDGDEDISGAVLQCESKGWYPKPEVLWLDGEGNLLSAGPAETNKGPDGLYTVSSRVAVEKKHSKSFTCRVQQKNIDQTRETTFYVSDDLFKLQSSSSALTAGLAVSLSLCILLILLLLLFMWRLKRSKTKKTHQPEEGREREQLMSAETEKLKEELQILKKELEEKKKEEQIMTVELKKLIEEMEKNMMERKLQTLKKELEKKTKELEEMRNRGLLSRLLGPSKEQKEKEKEVETLKMKLEALERELKTKVDEAVQQPAEVQQLDEDIQKKEMDLQTLKEELTTKFKELNEEIDKNMMELQALKDNLQKKTKEVSQQPQQEQQRRKEAENKVKNLEDQLETKNKEVEFKQTELPQLNGKIQRNLLEQQTLKDKLEQKSKELEEMQKIKGDTSVSVQMKEDELKELKVEIQKKEKELQTLLKELEQKNKEDPYKPLL